MFYVGNEFSLVENKAYKTQAGAEKAAEAAGMNVYDDVGNVLFPPAQAAEGAETVNRESNSIHDDVNAETTDEENASGGDCVPIIGTATVVWMGKLRIRNAPSFARETECGLLDTGDSVEVAESVQSDDGKPMWKTADGYFISADMAHTRFIEQ